MLPMYSILFLKENAATSVQSHPDKMRWFIRDILVPLRNYIIVLETETKRRIPSRGTYTLVADEIKCRSYSVQPSTALPLPLNESLMILQRTWFNCMRRLFKPRITKRPSPSYKIWQCAESDIMLSRILHASF
jgi:hypothetical protein